MPLPFSPFSLFASFVDGLGIQSWTPIPTKIMFTGIATDLAVLR